jgi:3-phosphoshikimate 1-carboxyvinyltransferase
MPLTMEDPLHGSVRLPLSKSESQRALMIAAYGGFLPSSSRVSGDLSAAHDTVLLQDRLRMILATEDTAHSDVLEGAGAPEGSGRSESAVLVDCEDAGTVARFLLPLLAGRPGTWLVTGTPRLCQRPMAPLVKALRQLGADIESLGSEGMLPLRVQGRPLRGGALTLDASQSSQFASALLLAAPMWAEGLQLRLEVPVASRPYLDMTLAMMRQAGAEVRSVVPEVITVLPKPYQSCRFHIAADWSAASYWYELAALDAPCHLLLEGLRPSSLQGDAVVAEWFERLGVHTAFDERGAVLTSDPGFGGAPTEASLQPAAFGPARESVPNPPLAFHFEQHPDLFPAVLVACVALHRSAVFTGIRNLSSKESDRVHSLITELSKLYTFINIIEDDRIIIQESRSLFIKNDACVVTIETYQDHRVFMAIAPLKTRFPGLVIRHPEVTDKSYPGYWRELETLIG